MSKRSLRALTIFGLLVALAEPARADKQELAEPAPTADKQNMTHLYKADMTPLYKGCDGFAAATDAADNMTEFAGILSMYTLSTFAGTHTAPIELRPFGGYGLRRRSWGASSTTLDAQSEFASGSRDPSP